MDRSVFPKVLMTGEVKGYLSPVVAQLIGREGQVPVPLIAAAQHDSASAAHAVPAETEDYIFINSGTWSIIGSIIDEPVITREVFEQNYSNEGAAYGKIKLVNTIMGMWLVQELRKSWEEKGRIQITDSFWMLLQKQSLLLPSWMWTMNYLLHLWIWKLLSGNTVRRQDRSRLRDRENFTGQ